jgi:hypothetical protein
MSVSNNKDTALAHLPNAQPLLFNGRIVYMVKPKPWNPVPRTQRKEQE